MKKGDTVNIYTDPITKTDLEGKAILVKCMTIINDFEIWKVRFEDEPDTIYERRILIP